MIVETFLLMRKYKQLKDKKDDLTEGYSSDIGSPDVDVAKKLSGILIAIIIIAAVMFLLSIWAMIDASRNCKDPVLHILLLFFIPAYLPVYFVLRLSGGICNKYRRV
jgi:hypothetical protein